MSRDRKKKKNIIQKQNSEKQVMTRFNDLFYGALKTIGQEEHFYLIGNRVLMRVYVYTIQLARPRAKVGFKIKSKDLQDLNDHIQHYARIDDVSLGDHILSTNAYSTLWAFVFVVENVITDKEHQALLREKFKIGINLDDKNQDVMRFVNATIYKALVALGNPRRKYFTYDEYLIKQDESHLARQLSPLISTCQAQSKIMLILGIHRPVFRLMVPYSNDGFRKMRVSADLLGDFYKGSQSKVDLFIQSHALNRFQERLDVLGPCHLNFYLWFNTCEITEIIFYKQYLLIPVMIQDIKVGYFFANVIGDELVFRTFLFVTHSSTPEGDKLKEITGLQKSDIKYWHIDRLSTIVSANIDTNPALHNLLKEVGIDGLLKLKDIVDKPECMQDILSGKLIAYIERGKKEMDFIS